MCNKLPPKHHALIKQILIMSQYGGQESGCSLLAGSSASWFLIKFHKVFTKGWVSSESSTRERITPKFMWLLVVPGAAVDEREKERERGSLPARWKLRSMSHGHGNNIPLPLPYSFG